MLSSAFQCVLTLWLLSLCAGFQPGSLPHLPQSQHSVPSSRRGVGNHGVNHNLPSWPLLLAAISQVRVIWFWPLLQLHSLSCTPSAVMLQTCSHSQGSPGARALSTALLLRSCPGLSLDGRVCGTRGECHLCSLPPFGPLPLLPLSLISCIVLIMDGWVDSSLSFPTRL